MAPPKSLPGIADDYTSKFFQGDAVTKLTDASYRGKVLRCWADEDGLPPPLPPGHEMHPLDRPLLRGEVGISDLKTGELSIVPESSLVLYQRDFLKGDVVKRSLTAVESAVVVDVQSEVQLQHAISKQKIKKWVPLSKVKNSLAIEARDRVVYNNWIGTVEEVFEDATVDTKNGTMYRLAEMGGFLEPGRLVTDVLPKDGGPLELFAHAQLPPYADPHQDIVVSVRPMIVYITWNAINQKLSNAEQETTEAPKKLWRGDEIKNLTYFDGMHASAPPLGTTVVFKDPEDDKAYGLEVTKHQGMIEFRAMNIVESRSRVTLRWQDGTQTEDWASELVPYHNIDDYEVWPGEHLVWRGDNGERRPAVVQSFNPHQRIADLYFTDNGERQTVSVLELDPGGPGKAHYGVGVGQQVLLCEDNFSPVPEVPALGAFDGGGDIMWWRNEMSNMAEGYIPSADPTKIESPQGDPSSIDWWGEVTELHLDGTVGVKVANGKMERVGIKNLHLLNDPRDMMAEEGMMDDGEGILIDELGGGDGYGEVYDDRSSDASWETVGSTGDRGEGERGDQWMDSEDEEEEHEEEEETMDVDDEDQEQRDVEAVNVLVSEPPSPSTNPAPAVQPSTPKAAVQPLSNGQAEAGPSSPKIAAKPALEDDEHWAKFEMLEEAPQDHHFIGELPNQAGSKQYHSRLNKEHRALMTSLPENILVRTYENRMDLLRVLIIGPEGTPYTDAPFVFDVYLNPTKFPHEPPIVHFHSHTFGKGRCNPNLYEEGKVCLSVLGTWSGEKSESWNPTKSSLLQVFVSISGLVLVRSPYHCEPAFAKLEGTKEGAINSRLYSEKAYVLSRSFVRTALERPPTGLEKELRHFYLEKGRLYSVIDHAKRLMEKGEADAAGSSTGEPAIEEENEEMWNADAMGSLTMGAILSLKRTVTVLEKIAEEQGAK